jgi:stress response protein SCP2
MAISLKKGQGVSLRKSENDLSSVTVGLGWDIAESPKGLMGSLFGKKEPEYDLDAVAFLCGTDGKVHDLGQREDGQPTLVGGDIVFFNSLVHASGHLRLTGDNRTGAGAGDDEQIVVRLDDLSDRYAKVVFIVQIYGGAAKRQTFAKVRSAYIRAVDGKGREMARFDLSGGPEYATSCSLLFAELVREADGWKFNAIGTPSPSDTFVDWLKKYL